MNNLLLRRRALMPIEAKNLFFPLETENGYLNTTTGEVTASAGTTSVTETTIVLSPSAWYNTGRTTPYIAVKKSSYLFTINFYRGSMNFAVIQIVCCFYDSNKNFLNYIKTGKSINVNDPYTEKISVPANAKFMRLSVQNGSVYNITYCFNNISLT